MPASNNASAGMGNSATRSNNSSAAPDTVTTSGGSTSATFISTGDLSGLSYTHSDPNNLESAYSYNSVTDIHTITLVGAAANADYSVNSAPNFTGPRWFKPLVDSAGVPVLAGDRFNLIVRHRNFSAAGGITQWGLYIGVSSTPASTVLLTLQANGAWMGVTGAGTPNCGAHAVNFATTVSLASATSARSTASFSGAPTRERAGVTSIITSSTAQDSVVRSDGAAISGVGISDTTQLSLWICATTLGTVVTTGGSISCGLDYAIVRIP